MKDYTLTIETEKGNRTVAVAHGTNLLKALREEDVQVHAPCGGRRSCAKCRVRLTSGNPPMGPKEYDKLGKAADDGWRLACFIDIEEDLKVSMVKPGKVKAQTEGEVRPVKLGPAVSKERLHIAVPSGETPAGDYERVLHELEAGWLPTPQELQHLPELVAAVGGELTAVVFNDRLTGLEPGDTRGVLLGVAVDIGTTTLAAYLVDLCTGERLAQASAINPQTAYGADVITRAEKAQASAETRRRLAAALAEAIVHLSRTLCSTAARPSEDIYQYTVAGNTVMLHLLLGVDTTGLTRSPFVPVFTRSLEFSAQDVLGKDVNPSAVVLLLPSLSAWLGADLLSAVTATGMNETRELTLLMDIGTNGEMVLGNEKEMMACSVAAGPAFEGAHIRNGLGGVSGAIDAVADDDVLTYTTIEGAPACGICGSGLIDLVARLLDRGIVDTTGRLLPETAWTSPRAECLKGRLVSDQGQPAFLVAGGELTADGQPVLLTQGDIREFQNAKAAVHAGVLMLAAESGHTLGQIRQVLLAGGFGSALHPETALRTGLIPAELAGRVRAVGNAAGVGALEATLSARRATQMNKLRKRIRTLVLSGNEAFAGLYVSCMDFESPVK